jgi:hypothetical protein
MFIYTLQDLVGLTLLGFLASIMLVLFLAVKACEFYEFIKRKLKERFKS